MNFGFTEEQELLRAGGAQVPRRALPARAGAQADGDATRGYSAELWQELAELGWLGLTIPEAHGGAGLGWVDLVVLLEETGRSLFPSPLVSTTLAAAAILDSGSDEQKARWLPGIADGTPDRHARAARSERRARADRHRAARQARRRRVRADRREDASSPTRAPRTCSWSRSAPARARRTWRSPWSTRGAPGVDREGLRRRWTRPSALGHARARERARAEERAARAKPGQRLARDRAALRPRRRRGHGEMHRRRRGRARAHRAVRQGAHPVRRADRQVPGREASARRDVRRRRVREVAALLRGLGARREPAPRCRAPRRSPRRTRATRSRASASTACSSTARSATPRSTTSSST